MMKVTVVALLMLVSVSHAQVSDESRLLNNQSFVDSFEVALAQSRQAMAPIPGSTWQKCTDLPVLERTCLGLYADESNLALGAFITFEGTKIFGHPIFRANYTLEFVSANTACMTQTDLLRLIELIPVLAPFDPAINKIINELKKIPVNVFSICVHFDHMDFSKKEIDGDAHLLANLMCLKGHCLKKIDHDFGNFSIPI